MASGLWDTTLGRILVVMYIGIFNILPCGKKDIERGRRAQKAFQNEMGGLGEKSSAFHLGYRSDNDSLSTCSNS